MDYSTLSNDPAEPSPWGSPRPDSNTFASAGQVTDVPSAPLPPHQQSPYGDYQESESGFAQGAAVEEAAETPQGAQAGEPASGQQPQSTARSEGPARYQTGARQNTRPPAPAYKLQGKITALERTGKKDPVLRFDVYVCLRPLFVRK
jgi:hypothetical protein